MIIKFIRKWLGSIRYLMLLVDIALFIWFVHVGVVNSENAAITVPAFFATLITWGMSEHQKPANPGV